MVYLATESLQICYCKVMFLKTEFATNVHIIWESSFPLSELQAFMCSRKYNDKPTDQLFNIWACWWISLQYDFSDYMLIELFLILQFQPLTRWNDDLNNRLPV